MASTMQRALTRHIAGLTSVNSLKSQVFPLCSFGSALCSVDTIAQTRKNGITCRREYHATPERYALPDRHGTTIVCVRKNGSVCLMGDGMVSQGSMIVKPNAVKLRRINPKNTTATTTDNNDEDGDNSSAVIVGFAGSTADAFTLLERLEVKLDEFPGQLARSCVELAKGWRTDKYLRKLEASLIVADKSVSLELSGNGDVLESHDGILGVGSGSPYAIAASRALMDNPKLSAEDVAKKAMIIASDMCVYTNQNFLTEIITNADDPPKLKSIENSKKKNSTATKK